MIVAATGHRPNKLGGYSKEAHDCLVEVAYNWLIDNKINIEYVIVGMAQGWDQAVAEACIKLNIKFTAAIPFTGQEDMWPPAAREKYYSIIANPLCTRSLLSLKPYSLNKMQGRNEWMVDRATDLLAMYNGDQYGGTFNCLMYANMIIEKHPTNLHNLYPQLLKTLKGKNLTL